MNDAVTRVREVFARLTRYPLELLDMEADLESDLGIDSLKRAEIAAALGREFGLAPDILLQGEDVATIAGISRFLERAMNGSTSLEHGIRPEPAASPESTPPSIATGGKPRGLTVNGTHRAPSAAGPPPSSMSVREAKGYVPVRQARNSGPPLADGLAWAAAEGTAVSASAERPFEGKIALVTGSGHGIGAAIVDRLADLGADVIVNSFHSRDRGEARAAAIQERGGRALYLWGSVANPEQLDRIFDQIGERFGALDFFVNNASNGIIAPIEEITPAHWERAFNTNVVSLHRGAMRCRGLMAPRGGGKILCLSSPGAQRYIEHFACMGAAKAAMESLVRYLAIDLGPENIQVNAVSAGPVHGDLLNAYPDGERLIPYWESRTASGALGRAHDIVGPVEFLLSDAAVAITGSVMAVDAGGALRI